MKKKQVLLTALACVSVLMCSISPAVAVEPPSENIIWLDDLEGERIDPSALEQPGWGVMPQASSSVDGTYDAHAISAVTGFLTLQARSTITFHCSYSPSSASMDFGVLTPNNDFYSINVKGGSIDQTFGISQSGSYRVAIRNNSSQTVSVVGLVNY